MQHSALRESDLNWYDLHRESGVEPKCDPVCYRLYSTSESLRTYIKYTYKRSPRALPSTYTCHVLRYGPKEYVHDSNRPDSKSGYK
jgi:hypothetical protein